jgi:nucleolar GTP-binding protein
MDTPGLLDRPEEARNEMERLTYASLAHLPTAVIFVIDPSGYSGEKSTLEAQLNIRHELKLRFPKRPWIDVVSKGDLDIPDTILEQLPQGWCNIILRNK